jgi:Heterokaryon incompatibility protein (HET)
VCPKTPHLELAREWLANCRRKHAACRNKNTSQYPTRLLWLSEDGTRAKLIGTNGSQSYTYVTLAHRWGARKPIPTKRENLQSRCESLALASFPELFRDAILTAYTLGFRYLWIDSLCIVHDDPEEWTAGQVSFTNVSF